MSQLQRTLAIAVWVAGCQATISLEAPPLTAEGSIIWLGTRGSDSVELYPAQPRTLPDLTLRGNGAIYAIGHRCPPDILAPGIPTGDIPLEQDGKSSALLPSAEEIFESRVGEDGQTTLWASLDALPQAAAERLARLPLPDFNYCRIGATQATATSSTIKVPDIDGFLFPNVMIDLGADELFIGSLVSFETFDFAGSSTSAYTFTRARGGRITAPVVPTRDPDRTFLTGDGHKDGFFMFGRNGLVRGALIGGEVELETVTATIAFPQIYEADLSASGPGEPEEHFLVTSGWYLAGVVRTGRELRTFRHFDGQRWDRVERFDVRSVTPGGRLTVSRIGRGEAVAIGLDGKDYSIFWWKNGELRRFEVDADDRLFGPLSRARMIPGYGIVVGTTIGALFILDDDGLSPLRPPVGEEIFGLFPVEGGLVTIANLGSAGASAGHFSSFNRSTGTCERTPVTERAIRFARPLRGGWVVVDYNTSGDSITYKLITPGAPPAACARP